MTFIARPPGICEPCWSRRVVNWMTALAFYCPHTRNFVHRAPGAVEWRVKRKISPERAQAWIDGAIEKAKAEAALRGIEWDQVDVLMRGVKKMKEIDAVMRVISAEADTPAAPGRSPQ